MPHLLLPLQTHHPVHFGAKCSAIRDHKNTFILIRIQTVKYIRFSICRITFQMMLLTYRSEKLDSFLEYDKYKINSFIKGEITLFVVIKALEKQLF